jgi:hypothetical protein
MYLNKLGATAPPLVTMPRRKSVLPVVLVNRRIWTGSPPVRLASALATILPAES